MRIYLFIRWAAWDLWSSEPFISLPLNIWGLQMVWELATLLSLSNLNRVLKLNSSLWVVSLPMYLPGGKQHEPLWGQLPGGCVSSPCQGLCRCACWGDRPCPRCHFALLASFVLGRSAEVFHACGDLSGSKGLSWCSGQLRPVVWLLKFSNWVWLASVWQLVVLIAAVMLRSKREVGVFPALGEKGGLLWFS